MTAYVDVLDLASRLKAAEEPFALATVVRAVSVTAAKAGAKAVIRPDGTIEAGWIGGGCARGATLEAAREALADGQSRLISVQPEELLAELGVKAGDSRDGVRFASNMCPSRGTLDIFVEPVLPRPALVVLGASPVGLALARQARQLGFQVTLAAPGADMPRLPDVDVLIDGFVLDEMHGRHGFIVVSTQGKGDVAALKAALTINASYRAFVGSRRKMTALRERLLSDGVDADTLDSIKVPAALISAPLRPRRSPFRSSRKSPDCDGTASAASR
jgi:xanthine dehydrogenase accessory factor